MKNSGIHASRENYSKLISTLPEYKFMEQQVIYHASDLSFRDSIQIDNDNKDALIVGKNRFLIE